MPRPRHRGLLAALFSCAVAAADVITSVPSAQPSTTASFPATLPASTASAAGSTEGSATEALSALPAAAISTLAGPKVGNASGYVDGRSGKARWRI